MSDQGTDKEGRLVEKKAGEEAEKKAEKKAEKQADAVVVNHLPATVMLHTPSSTPKAEECYDKNAYLSRVISSVESKDSMLLKINSFVLQLGRSISSLPSSVSVALDSIHSVLKETFGPTTTLSLYGSTVYGCATVDSDLDITFCIGDQDMGLETKRKLLKRLSKVLRQRLQCQCLAILRCRVPLIKLEDKNTNIKADLSTGNAAPIPQARLLQRYSNMDSRISKLAILVKHWSRTRGINDGANLMNSYCYCLLVLHFCQTIQPPILPILDCNKPIHGNVLKLSSRDQLLQDSKFQGRREWVSENVQTLSELLGKFFKYYAEVDMNVRDFGLEKIVKEFQRGDMVMNSTQIGDLFIPSKGKKK
ncbi:hypothetical protein GUITHDRAFT_105213 [Guillardia theta CCMP2712]|uniref:Poly(A) RNA polymerase mitochondrial-like central palm domain-containing protein n=1 Tax=Guillardia theta (strain CCMP2712) TaxID=905079 RepID=L1JLR5_GUITC|nr:hypothetical protein GUITHDRAFT_105213 [Guillardia theta CCMP2712]EKX49134.1 hypothetical protein GUITHDRAFT_105213 [Guillardia theta CCMP2712]|eukprot:XP_005836114.1 hypothetical protein GUITHDRAFT_105213 [Guillardia theta CCMP2712]